MLEFRDYIADWPDTPYSNFAEWLEGIVSRWGSNTAILYRTEGKKKFTRLSYAELGGECFRVARSLRAAGLTKGDRVALWAENRPEWMAVWLGAVSAGMVIVPIDFRASEKECVNILSLTGAKALFHSSRKRAFAESLAAEGIPVQAIFDLDDGSFSWRGNCCGGADSAGQAPESVDIAARDPASIVFTSGTMGFAKGVTLTHKGIIANASAAIRSLRAYPSDVFINVLPLHHTYPTTCSFIAPLTLGASVIIVEKLVGSVVLNDIRDAKGTFLIAVPLLYDKMMAGIERGYRALPRAFQALFGLLRTISLREAKKGRIAFGRVFLKIIRRKAGLHSIRMMVAGGGPLDPKTADFFDSFGFNIVHGYGTSENGPLISVNTPWHKRNESVGLPVNYTEIKILEPDDKGVGEIAVKSPSVMLGYYRDPKSSAEVMTEDGWLKTGDIGFRDGDGYLYINGRKKNIIVSSGGKNIYPEEIEACFGASRIVGEILVFGRKEGDSFRERIFAMVVPAYESINADFPGKEGDGPFVRSLVKNEIERVNRGLPGYKRISDFVIRDEPFEKNAQQKIRRFFYT